MRRGGLPHTAVREVLSLGPEDRRAAFDWRRVPRNAVCHLEAWDDYVPSRGGSGCDHDQ